MKRLIQGLRGVAVVVPTVDREIPGSTPGRHNLQIKITSVDNKDTDDKQGGIDFEQ